MDMHERAAGHSGVLRAAARLVDQGWVQGAGARNDDGEPCTPYDPAASAWSAEGAIWAALPDAIGNADMISIGAALVDVAADSLDQYIEDRGDSSSLLLNRYNDAPDRTAHEVAGFLEAVADGIDRYASEGASVT